jgi:hypothetical protein
MIVNSSVRRLGLAAASTLLPLLLPAAAFAATATASDNVNVRSGPGTQFGVVAQIQQGDAVDVSKCQGSFCYVTYTGGKAGWVSASYLTRDSVAKPQPSPQDEPIIASAKPGQPPAPAKPAAPQIASVPPAPGGYPSAYGAGHGNPGHSPDFAPLPGSDGGYADVNGPAYTGRADGSVVTLPPDAGDVIASTDRPGAPRPKADIPQADGTGPGGDFIADDGSNGPYDSVPEAGFTPPQPGDGWSPLPVPQVGWRLHRGPGARFADLPEGPGRARACFLSEGGDGRQFCLGVGQSVSELGNRVDRIYAIRNPRGLKVTICSNGARNDCQVYDTSGPIDLPPDAAMASVTVDPPAGY